MNTHSILRLETTRRGASVLLVFIMTGGVFMLSMSYWNSSQRQAELVIERIEYEQHFRLVEGALKYGVMYAQHYFNQLITEHERVVELREYAQLLSESYTIVLLFYPQKKESVRITATLCDGQRKLFYMLCRVNKKGRISGWSIGR